MESRNGNGVVNVAFDGTNDNVKITSLPKPINGATNELRDSENKVVDAEDGSKKPERDTWGHGLEFLMSCISMSVGLGNVWRFPFTAFENGGGAFLIPYIVVLILVGKPLYYLEMICGQFTSRASIKVWEAVPALKGVAIGQLVGTTSVLTYYCSLIALTLYYMFRSFSFELPWSTCMSKWSENCINASSLVVSDIHLGNTSSSSQLYFTKEVIKEKNNIDDGIGSPDLELTFWLFLAWLALYLVIVKGVKSSGKVAYFTAIFPYVILLVLLVRAVTLEGATNGILYFIEPKFDKLLEPKVWKEAVVQLFFSLGTGLGPVISFSSYNLFTHDIYRCTALVFVVWYQAVTQLFFSLSVGMGSIVMFSSYNQFDHNIYRDALIVTSLDTVTSLIAGFTIFGILGNLAHNIGETDISKVIRGGGSGLAFISYPEAISKLQFAPQVFSVLFFFMLFVLGIGSAVALQSTVITNVMDHLPKGKFKYWQVAGVGAGINFLLGLAYVTPGGQWMLTIVDHFGGTFIIFALAILQIAGLIWIYGLDNFCWDCEFMLGRKVTAYWRVSWAVITPGIMIIIFVYNMINLKNPTYGQSVYPSEYIVVGWIIFILGISQVIIWFLWIMGNQYFDNSEYSKALTAFKKGLTPTNKWGPRKQKQREEWMRFVEEAKLNKDLMIQQEGHTKVQQILYVFSGRYSNL